MEFDTVDVAQNTGEGIGDDKPTRDGKTPALSQLSNEFLADTLKKPENTVVIESNKDGEANGLERAAMTSKAGRIGYVTAKGIADTPGRAIDSFAHDLENPENIALKVGGGMAFGAGMRLTLPKSGAGRAIVGGVFAFHMAKDALKPITESYSQAWDADNVAELRQATDTFATGVGHFTYDTALTLGAANWGERGMERIMRGTMGNRQFTRFEAYKQEMWTSDNHILGNTINTGVRSYNRVKTSVSESLGLSRAAEKAGESKPRLTDLERDQAAGKGLAEYRHHVEEKMTYSRGVALASGERIGLSETVSLLESGINPRSITLAEAKSAMRVELTDLKPEVRGLRAADQGKVVEKAADTKSGDTRTGDSKADGKSDIVGKIDRETNPDNIYEMSKLMKEQMARMDEEGMAVADRVEGDIGPVYTALKTEHRPLDQGYGEVAGQMFKLGEQVQRADDYQQVGMLFGYFRDAANQWNLGNATSSARLAQELNLLSIEIHTGLKQGLRRAGLKPEEVLAAKNPPLFTVRNDGGAGPHTIPEINGVWDVDVVLWPRNMMPSRSIATSGINGHEIGHNQYGGLLRFEESIRDDVIGNAVAKGLEAFRKEQASKNPNAKVSETVEVPGHGQVSRQELYEGILKAQANENTSDIWGTAWTGPNSALSLGVLLQSLRKGGKLENRNVMGSEYKGDGNPLGFEVHGMDRFRIKLSAEVLRQRANGDPLVLEYARNLDRYADVASREGDYTWSSLDKPGQSISVPKAEFEAMIPHLVEVQLNQPLPALKGKSFGEILPDMPNHVRKMNELADIIVDGVKAGREPSAIPFDVNQYTINQVFGSGMPAAMRLMAEGMSAKDANAWVNRYSDHFRSQYLKLGDPHIEPLGPTFNIQQLQIDPVRTLSNRGLAGLSKIGTGTRNGVERFAPTLSGYTGGILAESLVNKPDGSSFMDITRQSIADDAEAQKKILGH